jgi:hypothetical protein
VLVILVDIVIGLLLGPDKTAYFQNDFIRVLDTMVKGSEQYTRFAMGHRVQCMWGRDREGVYRRIYYYRLSIDIKFISGTDQYERKPIQQVVVVVVVLLLYYYY